MQLIFYSCFGRSAHRRAKVPLRVQAPDRRICYSMAELLLHIFCLERMPLHRTVKIVSLNIFDLHALQHFELFRSLNTFHADTDSNGLCQLCHHLDKGLGIGIPRQILDEALIHLDDINGDLPDMVQGRITGTEIIQCQSCLLYTSPSPRDCS